MNRTRLSFVLVAALAACSGHDDSSSEGPRVRALYDLSGTGSFFALPWPADVRARADGTADASAFPNPSGNPSVEAAKQMVATDARGFSPSSATYFGFDGPTGGVRPLADPLGTLDDGAPYFIVALDDAVFGERTPALVQWSAEPETYRPGNTLEVLPYPGNLLRRNTTYATVVLRQAFVRPDEVAPNGALATALRGDVPTGELGTRLRDDLAPLVRYLDDRGIRKNDVVAASVYTIGDMTARMNDFTAQVLAEPPVEVVAPYELLYEDETYCALSSAVRVPVYQQGTPPFLTRGGILQTDGAGRLVTVRYEEAPFVVTFPNTPMPADGYPLMVYVHGTGGTSDQAVARGPRPAGGENLFGAGPSLIAGERGWGTATIAGMWGPERLGDAASLGGFGAYNFFNPPAMRDNFHNMLLDQIELVKLVGSLEVDASLCPQATSPTGTLRYDVDHLAMMGQSLGSFLTGMLSSLLEGIDGAILTGAGGGWGEFARGPTDPIPLQAVLEAYLGIPDGEELDRFHPVIALFDLAIGPSDNLPYLRRVLDDPPPGRSIPHVLVIEGTVDEQVTANLQRSLVAALDVDLVGGSATSDPDETLEEAIRVAGGQSVSGVLRANRTAPDGTPRTFGVVRYEEDGIMHGHFVAFQLDAPKHAYGCFLDELLDPGDVPPVFVGTARTDPCP